MPNSLRFASGSARDSTSRRGVGLVMGHRDSSIAGAYRERIDDARLSKVADYVRAWLFGIQADAT